MDDFRALIICLAVILTQIILGVKVVVKWCFNSDLIEFALCFTSSFIYHKPHIYLDNTVI